MPRVVRAFLNVSLGRLRFAMGGLSWLAHAPLLGEDPAQRPLAPPLVLWRVRSRWWRLLRRPESSAGPNYQQVLCGRLPPLLSSIEQAVDEPGSRRRARPAPAPTAFAYVSLARSVSPASTLVVRLPGIGADHVRANHRAGHGQARRTSVLTTSWSVVLRPTCGHDHRPISRLHRRRPLHLGHRADRSPGH